MVERRPIAPAPAAPPPRKRVIMPPPAPEPAIEEDVKFTTSGSHLLDKVLGGGWAQGRVVNVVGDKSSGKTLLAIEACANFVQIYGSECVRYVEAEAAFDEGYAASIGMPKGIELEADIRTVEHWEDDLVGYLEKRKPADGPCLYVLDSLDALSDDAEMKRKREEGSYGAAKAKSISEMFRKRIKLIEDRRCTLFIISQIRDKIGVTFGETKQRSGGHALDFYASQVIWLTEKMKLKRTVLGAERVVGMQVGARAKKNKVGKPFREADLSIYFSYGVDDEISMLNWIKKHNCEKLLALDENTTRAAVLASRVAKDRAALRDLHEDIASAVSHHWDRIEALLAPPLSKYGD